MNKLLYAYITDMFFNVTGIIMVPIGLLLPSDPQHMPKLFWPWDNHEEPEGLWGGGKWKHNHPEKRKTFWYKYWWAAFRNPAHNWCKFKLGVKRPCIYETLSKKTLDQVRRDGGYHHGVTLSYDAHFTEIAGKYPQYAYYGRFINIRFGWYYSEREEYMRFCPLIVQLRIK